jgi:hypothetical protein
MRHIKLFEDIYNTDDLKIGDYVIVHEENSGFSSGDEINKIIHFINNNIGQYVHFDITNKFYAYLIKFENIPENINKYFENDCRRMSRSEIIIWTDSIEEIELKYNANK